MVVCHAGADSDRAFSLGTINSCYYRGGVLKHRSSVLAFHPRARVRIEPLAQLALPWPL